MRYIVVAVDPSLTGEQLWLVVDTQASGQPGALYRCRTVQEATALAALKNGA